MTGFVSPPNMSSYHTWLAVQRDLGVIVEPRGFFRCSRKLPSPAPHTFQVFLLGAGLAWTFPLMTSLKVSHEQRDQVRRYKEIVVFAFAMPVLRRPCLNQLTVYIQDLTYSHHPKSAPASRLQTPAAHSCQPHYFPFCRSDISYRHFGLSLKSRPVI